MEATLYYNKSDNRYLNKTLETIGTATLELIEPSSIITPRLIFAKESRIQEANYLFLPTLGRYYYINNYIFEYERIIAECKVDVLMSYRSDLMKLNVIIDRATDQYNLYLDDDKAKLNNYSSFQTLKFTTANENQLHFDKNTEQLVMVCSGSL